MAGVVNSPSSRTWVSPEADRSASSSTCSNDVVSEAPAVVDLASHLTPLSIRHGRLDLAWSALAVLEDWTTPRYSEVAGTPLESKRFRVRVRGPLPGMSSKEGEFVMIARRYGGRDGWWISPEMALADTRREPELPRSGERARSVPDGAVNRRDPRLLRGNWIRRRPALTLLRAGTREAF